MSNVTSTPQRRFAAKISLWRYRLRAVFQRLRKQSLDPEDGPFSYATCIHP
jgi:hypothetical protein